MVRIVLAVWITGIFVTHSAVNTNPLAKLENLMNGTASKPWVYRQLVPKTVAVLNFVTPNRVSSFVEAKLFQYPRTAAGMKKMAVVPTVAYEAALAVGIGFFSLLGYAFFIERSAALCFPDDSRIGVIAVLLAFFALPPNLFIGYFYDLPVLCLSAAMLYFIGRRQYVRYLVVFVLACLNKETSILFLLLFVLQARNEEPKRFWRYVALQLGLGLLILTVMRVIYRANPGRSLMSSLDDQILNIASLYSWERLATFLLIFLLVAARSAEKPILLRRALWLLVPFFGLFMWGGRPNEFRVFYEVHPPLILLSAHTIAALCFRAPARLIAGG